jgi:hypothetical protein
MKGYHDFTFLCNTITDSDLPERLRKSVLIVHNDDNTHSWFTTGLVYKLVIELDYEMSLLELRTIGL